MSKALHYESVAFQPNLQEDWENMVPREGTYSDFDLASALETTGGDRKLLKELADIFLHEYPGLLLDLRLAVLRRDGNAVEWSAHKLKGSVTNFGARVAGESAARLEKLGSSRNLKGIDESLRQFETAFDAFLTQLRSFRP